MTYLNESPATWRLDTTSARYHCKQCSYDIEIERTNLVIEAREGTGVDAQSTRCSMPMSVLKELLDHAGYDVRARPTG